MFFINKSKVATNFQRYTAFTLAEILITLGIIGVVAALTIPTLMNEFEERILVTAAKKYYSTLYKAVEKWEYDNGCIGNIRQCLATYPMSDCQTAFSQLEQPMGVIDRVYAGSSSAATSWLPSTTTSYDKSSTNYGWGVSRSSNSSLTCKYLLKDGATMAVIMPAWGPPLNTLFGSVVIDVNGKKPPNRMGKDTFPMGLASYNLKSEFSRVNPYFVINSPAGLCLLTHTDDCNPDDGLSPTAYVLTHDKLPDTNALFGN